MADPKTKGERTRERIIAAAADLFHQQGINVTSVGDILRASNTGKGQFYLHFASRDELVNVVLERHQAFLAGEQPIRTWDDVQHWMRHHLAMQQSFGFDRGCPVGTAAYALQPDQDTPRSTLQTIFGRMADNLGAFFRQEQAAGRLRNDADPTRLAVFTIASVQGAMLLGVLDHEGRSADAAITEAFEHLRSLIPKE